jgi:hypothetical protein
VYEGGISTPLIVRWPRGIKTPGTLRHNPGHVIDLVPTILDAAGIDRIPSWHGLPVPNPPGKSLVPVFSVDNSVAHEYLWWLHEDNRAIRVGDWKLVADNKQKRWELYDLAEDRGESVNLAEKFPEKVQELSKAWEDRWREFRELATQAEPRLGSLSSSPRLPVEVGCQLFPDYFAPTVQADRVEHGHDVFDRRFFQDIIVAGTRHVPTAGRHDGQNFACFPADEVRRTFDQ